MSQVGSMHAKLELESASFLSGMKKAAEETSRTSKAITGSLDTIKGAVGGLAAVMAVDVFVQATKAALDYSDAIADLADRTGASTKFIQEFGYAAQLSGSDVETARASLEKFSKTVGDAANGNEAAQKKLKEYGITALDVDTAVTQAADAVKKLDNPTKQLAATTDLFGKKAGTLTQTLAGGAEGLKLQARAAKDLGIVLEDSVIRNAGQANDKLDTMKMILDAKMAAAISQNAGAIVSMADGMMKLTGAIIDFHQSNPGGAYAIIGALAGARIAGGYGALIGAAGGAVLGVKKDIDNREADNDLGHRTTALRYSTNRLLRARSEGRPDYVIKRLEAGHEAERKRMDRALQEHAQQQALRAKPSDTLPTPSATAKPAPTKSGPSAAELALKEAERVARVAADTARGQMDILKAGGIYDSEADLDYYKKLARNSAKESTDGDDIVVTGSLLDKASRQNQEALLGGDHELAYSNTIREIQSKYQEQLTQLELSVRRGDIKAGSEEETVRAQLLYQKLLDENAADWEQRNLRAREQSETDLTELGIKKETLGLQGDLARTQADRRRIALQILDLELKERDARLAQQQIGLDPNTAAYKNIQSQRDALATQGASLRQGVIRNTAGPMAQMLDSIPQSAAEANEALENIAAQGLDSLTSGLADAIMGVKSFGEAFEEVAKMVIKAILEMVVKMMIVTPIMNAIGPSLGFSMPAKANGGLSSGGATLVGERGPEIVNLPAGSNVIPHHALSSVSGRSGGTVINVDARGSTNEALVQTMVVQGIQAAMPQIKAASMEYTMGRLSRDRL